MKGCIALQRQWAVIGNAMALELKNKHGVEEFCGYITTRRAERFINSQKDVEYTALLLDEDLHNQYKQERLDIEYLKKLEAEYGIPNLWLYMTVDRTIMMNIPPKEYSISPAPPYTHEEMLRIMQVKFRNIIKFFEKEKPDFIIMPPMGSMGAMVLYGVAKKMGIKTFVMGFGRIKKFETFTEDFKTLTGVEEIFKKIRKENYKSPHFEKAKKFLEDFTKKPISYYQPPKNSVQNSIQKIKNAPISIFNSIKFILVSTVKYLRDPHRSDKTTENPWYALVNKLTLRIRSLRNLKRLYDEPKLGEDFAYFPLHLEPEISLDFLAPFFTNQLALISQIAKSLPSHFKLYVKEHQPMLNYRPTKYYKELKKIPSVRFINTATNSFDLIKNSKIIITITGTVGWEAALLKKPVITFGDIFFNSLSMVKKCKTIEDLPYIIKQQLENFKYDEKEAIDMISALFEDAINFDHTGLWEKGDYEQIKNDPDFPKFVSVLAKKLGLSHKG
ncbi:MAG: hypothetical protein AAB621_00180 [Patescibacteria group bacterium]